MAHGWGYDDAPVHTRNRLKLKLAERDALLESLRAQMAQQSARIIELTEERDALRNLLQSALRMADTRRP